eukprot:SAG31_NODE_3903_length_3768_cov_2.589806_2_plen_70_part_00
MTVRRWERSWKTLLEPAAMSAYTNPWRSGASGGSISVSNPVDAFFSLLVASPKSECSAASSSRGHSEHS